MGSALFHLFQRRAASRNDMPGNRGDYASCRKRFLPVREGKGLGKKFMTRVLATVLGLRSAEERTTESEQALQQAPRRIPL